mgnify:CR=1 FL=1
MLSIYQTEYVPGVFVINEDELDWGIGQIQSSINDKIIVNFENVGKKAINAKKINLKIIKV